jgi:hypothetical protein
MDSQASQSICKRRATTMADDVDVNRPMICRKNHEPKAGMSQDRRASQIN